MKVYTIGHSTRTLEEFLETLKHYNINLIIDVRKFPTSKRLPWFNKEVLEKETQKLHILYVHFPELGGFRKEGYEQFTKSEDFTKAIDKLIEIMDSKVVAIMCSEFLWWRCHRKYVADILAKNGFEVIHVFDKERVQEHKLKEKEIEERMKQRVFCDKKAKKSSSNETPNSFKK